jgi:helix-turn-helix protein
MDARTEDAIDARVSLAAWLRAGRDRRKLTLDDVAKITKIQIRILEKLEAGQLEGLPAEVFVKGFVRSFAKCVGLDESEAIDKYSAAQAQPPSMAVAKALVETMARPVDLDALLEARRLAQGTPAERHATLAFVVAEPPPVIEAPPVFEPVAIEAAPAIEPSAPTKKKRSRKNSKQRAKKKKEVQQELAAVAATVEVVASPVGDFQGSSDLGDVETAVFEKQSIESIESIETGPVAKIDAESIETASIEAKTNDAITQTSIEPEPIEDGAVEAPALAAGSERISQRSIDIGVAVEQEIIDTTLASDVTSEPDLPTGSWQPTMPTITSASSVPWRRPNLPATSASAYVVPTLVIDDSDPDSADRERDDRAAKEPHRLSFLPPILMDREDRSARQGGLTLAVIILLIAATLTLSYLMRRPSPSGDGVTFVPQVPGPASLIA